MRTTDKFPIKGIKKRKVLSQRQLHMVTAVTEGVAILLLIVRAVCKIIWGQSAFTTFLMFLVSAVTFVIVLLIVTRRIEKDDELSEMNKLRAYCSTFFTLMSMVMVGASAVLIYAAFRNEPSFTVKISVDGIVQFFLILLSLFNFFNSFYFLRLDSDGSSVEDE